MCRFSLLLAPLLVTACQSAPPTKAEVVQVPGPTLYVPIDPKLTAHPRLPPLVTTSPLQCPAVANERWELLGQAYRQLDAIGAVQGTKTP